MAKNTHLHYIDHLKIALIMLVVAHHAGQAYGPGGWWYFKEDESIEWLKRFFSVNAAFFMSLFFFLSAYFLPQSLEKKGPNRFLWERFNRIGIPLLLGFLIMIPILMYCYYISFRGYESIHFFTYYAEIFFGFATKPVDWTGPSWPDMQFGHLWFLEHLLVYAVLLALWKKYFPTIQYKQRGIHGWGIFGFFLVVSMVTFVIRVWYPIDQWTGVLGFIQTEYAHLPQYVAFFIVGILAYKNNWLVAIRAKTGWIWLSVGIAISLCLYLGGDALYPYLLKGGANFGSLTRSLIETLLCMSLVIGLVTLFREKCNATNRFTSMLSNNVFVVYFIHVPVVVVLQYFFDDMVIPVTVKFLVTSFLGIFISFAFAHFVWRRIPFLKKMM